MRIADVLTWMKDFIQVLLCTGIALVLIVIIIITVIVAIKEIIRLLRGRGEKK